MNALFLSFLISMTALNNTHTLDINKNSNININININKAVPKKQNPPTPAPIPGTLHLFTLGVGLLAASRYSKKLKR